MLCIELDETTGWASKKLRSRFLQYECSTPTSQKLSSPIFQNERVSELGIRSVSVSKIFSLEKKSRYRSQKYLVSKKSLGIGLENFGLKKSLGIGLENFGLKKSLSNDLKKFVLENFGLQKLWTW